jgi:hypothetical protein
MENGNKKIAGLIVAAVAILLILGGFYLSSRANSKSDAFDPMTESTRDTEALTQTVEVKHQYKDGVHTWAGEINLPTPCDSVEVKAEKDSADANKVMLMFTTSNTAEVCTQVITARRFKTTIVAPENIQVTGTLNGAELKLNIFEVPKGENLDAFEIDIKG